MEAENHLGNLVGAAVIGGTASELGGGKFANGAVRGAMAYALGELASRSQASGSYSFSVTADPNDPTMLYVSGGTFHLTNTFRTTSCHSNRGSHCRIGNCYLMAASWCICLMDVSRRRQGLGMEWYSGRPGHSMMQTRYGSWRPTTTALIPKFDI
jgi:hypothetical protein